MGSLLTRASSASTSELQTTNLYTYPPKSGCYFGNFFIMGGEKFETSQPEGYLFGENNDLNFLGSKPVSFPYTASNVQEPIRTLKSFINIRKDTVRFVRVSEEVAGGSDSTSSYNIEFVFDADADVSICIYYQATEESTSGHLTELVCCVRFKSKVASQTSDVYQYKRGAGQLFSQCKYVIDTSQQSVDIKDGSAGESSSTLIVIHCVVQDQPGHEHVTYASVDKLSDGCYVLKPLKQKHVIDNICYLLQEIYGIENKNPDRIKGQDEEADDNSCECIICMSELRDTLILPCRHLCLCKICADNLRYQANNCPICRAPFIALLRVKAVCKTVDRIPALPMHADDSAIVSGGFKAVPLIIALNGAKTTTEPTPPPLPGAANAKCSGIGDDVEERCTASREENSQNTDSVNVNKNTPKKTCRISNDIANNDEAECTVTHRQNLPEEATCNVEIEAIENRDDAKTLAHTAKQATEVEDVAARDVVQASRDGVKVSSDESANSSVTSNDCLLPPPSHTFNSNDVDTTSIDI